MRPEENHLKWRLLPQTVSKCKYVAAWMHFNLGKHGPRDSLNLVYQVHFERDFTKGFLT
jgi:hypothetical protein